MQRRLRKIAWLVVACLIASCSSASNERIGSILREIPDEVRDSLYGEGNLPGGPPSVTPIELDVYLSKADPAARALHEHATTRGVGELIEAATLSYPDGVTATVAVTAGPGGRLGMVVSNASIPGEGYFTTIDGNGVLEVSSPEFLIRLRPGGEMVEEWDAHSSCRWSHCVGAALGFLVNTAVWDATVWVIATTCGLATDPDTVWTCEVTCVLCVAAVIGAGMFMVPTILAAMTDCTADSCRWCFSDDCGATDVTGRLCAWDSFDRSPTGADWVLLETRDVYYCADPDEYSFCRTHGEIVWVEDCPYGCDQAGEGGSCLSPPPTCDPAACEQSVPIGTPSCEIRPDDGITVIVQTFEEQHCRPADPRGEECLTETVERAVQECEYGCARDGQSCAPDPGSRLTLRVFQPLSGGSDAYVLCAACRIQLEGVTGTFEGTTAIDGTVSFDAVPAGIYVARYGCGPAELGPHLPADLIFHPDVPVNWVPALGPRMDTSVVLSNVVVPLDDAVDVLLGACG